MRTIVFPQICDHTRFRGAPPQTPPGLCPWTPASKPQPESTRGCPDE
jgi:hypothetical protein